MSIQKEKIKSKPKRNRPEKAYFLVHLNSGSLSQIVWIFSLKFSFSNKYLLPEKNNPK